MKTTLVILTRNEIEGVKALIDRLPLTSFDEYFVVDYRSIDGTVEYFLSKKIPVVRQRKPGRAEAFRTAIRRAKGDIVVFFSPDGNEDPGDIPKLVALVRRGADLAIASRFLPKSHNEEDELLFRWRAWANQGLTFLANILFNRKTYVTDTINGYRAIKKDVFTSLHIDAQGFAVEYQMSIRAMKRGFVIKEIPTFEGQRIGGHSTSRAIPTGLRFLYYLLREVL